MRFLVCITLAILSFVAACSAQCYQKELVLTDIRHPPKGCQDEDGVMHLFGSNWVRNCYECSCSTNGMSCCNMIPTAVNLPTECEMVVDRKACTTRMVLKSDKTKDCSPL